jgi:hypothetical protein
VEKETRKPKSVLKKSFLVARAFAALPPRSAERLCLSVNFLVELLRRG